MSAGGARTGSHSLQELFGLAPRAPGEHRYHGFISYSHAADGKLAPALERGLKRFAKPWYRTRALNVFRDEVALSANPDLWGSVRDALESSQFLILLASPDAAASEWVARETAYWLDHKPLDHLLIALTDGELRFRRRRSADGEPAPQPGNALPAPLNDAFVSEPRWIDLRWAHAAQDLSLRRQDFADAVAELAAPLHGRPKEELSSEEVRQHRRTLRVARAAVATIAGLLVLAIVAAIVAVGQRDDANRQRDKATQQAKVASSRELAALSTSLLPTNLSVALPLAVAAYRTDRNPQTMSALFGADLASPKLARILRFGSQVTQVAGSADGRFVVAGLADGRVVRWRLNAGEPETVLDLGAGEVTGVAINASGSVVAATDGSAATATASARAELWHDGSKTRLASQPGEFPYAVGVSPTGRTIVVAFHDEVGFADNLSGLKGRDAVELFGDEGGRPRSPLLRTPVVTSTVVLPSDRRLMLLDDFTGESARLRIPGLGTIEDATQPIEDGINDFGYAYSNDGRFFAFNRGGPPTLVWDAVPGANPEQAPLRSNVPVNAPTAMTLSPGGGELAAAQGGTIYVAPVGRDDAAVAEALTGEDDVNRDAMQFAAADELLSAAGESVAVWDLHQIDRLAVRSTTRIADPCAECSGATVTVSPDGERVALVDNDGLGEVVIQAVSGADSVPITPVNGCFGPPLWMPHGELVLLPYGICQEAQAPPTLPPVPSGISIVRPPGDTRVVADAMLDRGQRLAFVEQSGAMFVTTRDGAVIRRLGAPGDMVSRSRGLFTGAAAIDPADALAAEIDAAQVVTVAGTAEYRTVEIRNLDDGAAVRTLHPGPFSSLTFADGRLLLELTTGQLAVYTADGSRLLARLPGDSSFSGTPVGATSSPLVARPRTDGSVVLQDLRTGATLATFPSPAASPAGVELGFGLSPNGSTLVESVENFGGSAPFLLTRDLLPGHLASLACQTAGGGLTAADWRAYVGSEPRPPLPCE